MFSSDFFKINSFKKLFQEYDQSQCHTVLDPDQARHNVRPDLGPNCLQRLSADDTSRQIVNPILCVRQHLSRDMRFLTMWYVRPAVSDQPAHIRSLIRAFACGLNIL